MLSRWGFNKKIKKMGVKRLKGIASFDIEIFENIGSNVNQFCVH